MGYWSMISIHSLIEEIFREISIIYLFRHSAKIKKSCYLLNKKKADNYTYFTKTNTFDFSIEFLNFIFRNIA